MSNLGNKKTMAYNLKRLLQPTGLNIKEFSKIMGFKYTTVINWFKAERYPRIDKIEMMAAFFNVTKSDLVEEYDPITEKLTLNKQKLDYLFAKLDDNNQAHLLNTAKELLKQQGQAGK